MFDASPKKIYLAAHPVWWPQKLLISLLDKFFQCDHESDADWLVVISFKQRGNIRKRELVLPVSGNDQCTRCETQDS